MPLTNKRNIAKLTISNIIGGHRAERNNWREEVNELRQRLANAELQLKIAEYICAKLDFFEEK